ncbi:MAG: tripartite tricarboxylate transporter TctB family protein [Acidobacteria bacterium]|nr:tripartite tricarboxylate transporter TctB family protein [Acidobacteriota bacterium]
MPKIRNLDRWGALAWMVFAVFIASQAWALGLGTRSAPGPGMVFWGSAIILFFLSCLVLLRKPDPHLAEEMSSPIPWGKVISVLAALGLYIAFFEIAGFLVSTGLLMVVLLYLAGATSRVRILTVALGGTFCIYLLFHVWLKIRLPGGILSILP